jgi:hypothetical protein
MPIEKFFQDQAAEDSYWARQFRPEDLKQLAENGKQCTADGLPREGANPIPVIRLFMADGPWVWLLAYTYPHDPDRAFALVTLARHKGDASNNEYGDVRISELKTIRGAVGLPIERDIAFQGEAALSGYRKDPDLRTPDLLE